MSEISRQEFQRRRQALVEQMQPGSAALIFAAPEVTRSADMWTRAWPTLFSKYSSFHRWFFEAAASIL